MHGQNGFSSRRSMSESATKRVGLNQGHGQERGRFCAKQLSNAQKETLPGDRHIVSHVIDRNTHWSRAGGTQKGLSYVVDVHETQQDVS